MSESDFNDRIAAMEDRETVLVNRFETKTKAKPKDNSDGYYKYLALLVFILFGMVGVFLAISKADQPLLSAPDTNAAEIAQKRQEVLESDLSDVAKAAKLQELANTK
jgi:hypothetical protein